MSGGESIPHRQTDHDGQQGRDHIGKQRKNDAQDFLPPGGFFVVETFRFAPELFGLSRCRCHNLEHARVLLLPRNKLPLDRDRRLALLIGGHCGRRRRWSRNWQVCPQEHALGGLAPWGDWLSLGLISNDALHDLGEPPGDPTHRVQGVPFHGCMISSLFSPSFPFSARTGS